MAKPCGPGQIDTSMFMNGDKYELMMGEGEKKIC